MLFMNLTKQSVGVLFASMYTSVCFRPLPPPRGAVCSPTLRWPGRIWMKPNAIDSAVVAVLTVWSVGPLWLPEGLEVESSAVLFDHFR